MARTPAEEAVKAALTHSEGQLAVFEKQLQTALNDLRYFQDRIQNEHCKISHYKLAIEALEKRFDVNGEG